MKLTPEIAAQFIRLTLGHLTREYPHKLDHVMTGPEDVLAPSVLHPIFYGSFDWHSCVHGYWQVLRLARLHPKLAEAEDVTALANRMFTPGNVAMERAYLKKSSAMSFERPYGWAWAMALHLEAAQHDAPWGSELEPLARDFGGRFHKFLPKLTYPLRVGTHYNISFALTLAFDWAQQFDPSLVELIRQRATDWFAEDSDCQAWEPGGDEFLSPALCEALLMSRVVPGSNFASWLDQFLPRLASGEPATLFTPAKVSDRSDGKIVHLDGLNLSRAWCHRELKHALQVGTNMSAVLDGAANDHLRASLPHVSGDFMGEHWLATFAVLALTA
jgi:hypothetical protein